VQNLPAREGKEIEYRVVSTIANTGEAMGCSKYGFCVRTAKDAKRM
jgi:hypothetical protein